jgi:indolepyruvate ferredoxin oxidoreductase
MFDPFGHTAERRMERALIGEYRAMVSDLADRVTPDTLDAARKIAATAALVSGYGPVKEAGVVRYRARVAELLARLASPAAQPCQKETA